MKLLQGIQHFDLLAFNWCLARQHRDIATKISRVTSSTADGPLYFLIGLILAISHYWPLAKTIVTGFLIERLLYLFFKTTCKRNRPQEAIPGFTSAIVPSDKFSFPSGHTSAAFLMSGILSSAFPPLAWLLYPWALGVGASRVLLGVHFPSDVFAGAVLGSSVSLIVLHNSLI